MSKRYALVWCANYRRRQEMQRDMIETFQTPGATWEVLNPEHAGFLELARGYDGYVVSGSASSVVDDADTVLVRNIFAFLKQTYQCTSAPLVGICFGAQAIAQALGGEVGKNPSGQLRLGVEELTWNKSAPALGRSGDGRRPMLAESHFECVRKLPADSMNLAFSESTTNEVFLVSRRFLGIQGHPEITGQILTEVFLPFHKEAMDAKQWLQVMKEATTELEPGPVIDLARRLLASGQL